MEVLAIIPARGGSKSIPQKNISLLCGIPLIKYTIDCAESCKKLSKIILSSDDEKIIEFTKINSNRVEVPFIRPKYLSEDGSQIIDVIKYTLQRLEKENNYKPEIVVLLQPTSPFKLPSQIDKAINLFSEGDIDAVVSVIRVPHNMVPNSQMKVYEKYLTSYESVEIITRRQEKPVLFARNGPAILAIRYKNVINGELYPRKTIGFEMDRITSIDIDEKIDLEVAEALYPIWKKIQILNE